MFCIWIADNYAATATPITQTITFRSATGTISATFNPVIPLAGENFTITITGAKRGTEERVRDDSAGRRRTVCADGVGGQRGLLCLWLADSSSDSSPIASAAGRPLGAVTAGAVRRAVLGGRQPVRPSRLGHRGGLHARCGQAPAQRTQARHGGVLQPACRHPALPAHRGGHPALAGPPLRSRPRPQRDEPLR